uniref:cytochrome c oxidase subunit III n=1 Tax=Parachordodes pustulosus TaxID=3049253 RepID=UPI002E770382|nr:cytochrome c oxidase subunit III [Parachordodes pustulosus]WQH58893.1 cytochrome c oxidase subunit III [Parachordodes pustulosus]
MMNNPYYLIKNSFAPIFSAFSLLSIMCLTTSFMWKTTHAGLSLTFCILTLNFIFLYWFIETYRESLLLNTMTFFEDKSLLFSFLLFIVSEIMFFFSFFWSYLHYSFSPDFELGNAWPPMGLTPIPFFETPLLNTIVLLSSGVSITWAHHMFYNYNSKFSISLLVMLTILLGVYFSFLQWEEYSTALFSINDSVYGSGFFTATGFHGVHIIVGSLLLFSVLVKLLMGVNPMDFQAHFETAAWYWHFVDVVWLFLFLCMYWWGGA